MLAPLQLLDYSVDRVSYEQIRPESDVPPDPAEIAGIGFKMELQEVRDGNVYHLQLQVDINQEELPEDVEGHIYHRGSIKVSGWFAWVDMEVQEQFDNPRKLLLVNGMSILYGIARTHIVHLTEPGPAPRLMLPSISFFPLVDEWLSQGTVEDEGTGTDGE